VILDLKSLILHQEKRVITKEIIPNQIPEKFLTMMVSKKLLIEKNLVEAIIEGITIEKIHQEEAVEEMAIEEAVEKRVRKLPMKGQLINKIC